ncbi:MAG: MBL fold metallo-hydrolase [Oscillibacter sp.]|nr:MBL fold metallo-hydrolase [Oscillibacter sp.]
MLIVTFLDHSGFLIETERTALLFDFASGELPPLSEKPLVVFVSHRHADHFDPRVFALDDGEREVAFCLGSDFRLKPYHLAKWGITEETARKCRRCGKGETFFTLNDTKVETLPSTDEGVAFFVTADGHAIFHAGDLNWWHWAEDTAGNNANMAANFRAYTEPLRGRRAEVAMLPLDPRLGPDAYHGVERFLELMDAERFLPMHQWGDYAFTERFLRERPQYAGVTVPIRGRGERFVFE